MLRRLERCRPSSTNSTAAATAAGDSSPSVERSTGVAQRRHRLDEPGELGGRDVLAGVGDDAVLERREDVAGLLGRRPRALNTVEHGGLERCSTTCAVAALVERSRSRSCRCVRGGERVEVGDAGHDVGLAGAQGPAQRRWRRGSRGWRRSGGRDTPRALVDVRAAARARWLSVAIDLGEVVGGTSTSMPPTDERPGLLARRWPSRWRSSSG